MTRQLKTQLWSVGYTPFQYLPGSWMPEAGSANLTHVLAPRVFCQRNMAFQPCPAIWYSTLNMIYHCIVLTCRESAHHAAALATDAASTARAQVLQALAPRPQPNPDSDLARRRRALAGSSGKACARGGCDTCGQGQIACEGYQEEQQEHSADVCQSARGGIQAQGVRAVARAGQTVSEMPCTC